MRAHSSQTDRSDFFHDVIESWLGDGDVTIAAGQWAHGVVSELIPRGRARLLPARYDGRFCGVREVRLDDGPHHLHLDLGRVHQVRYAVAPSVCFGFMPGFEVRFLTVGPGGSATDGWTLSIMPTRPYRGGQLDLEQAGRFFRRAIEHARTAPDWVDVDIEPAVRCGPHGEALLRLLRSITGRQDGDWHEVMSEVHASRARPRLHGQREARCLDLLRDALELPDASLVIYRERTLVEFKTRKVDGVHRYEEAGHVSWQIGGLHDHHCHLALDAVTRVAFSAEAAPCQGGGLNYTVWFLTPEPSGNPWRRDGYFSVVLNRPYTGDAPRCEVIDPMFDLYRRYGHLDWVEADELFLDALAKGPPRRSSSGVRGHADA